MGGLSKTPRSLSDLERWGTKLEFFTQLTHFLPPKINPTSPKRSKFYPLCSSNERSQLGHFAIFSIFPSFLIFFYFPLFLHLFTFSILQIIFIHKIFNSDYFLLFLIQILLSPPLSHLTCSARLREEPGVIHIKPLPLSIFFNSFSLFIYLFLARQNVLISSMFWGVLRPSHPS